MIHARSARRRLTVAVTAALAVTTGASASLVLAPPVAAATSAPAAEGDAAEAEVAEGAPVDMPPGVVVSGIGRTGFLTLAEGSNPRWRWTRFSDGSTTEMNGPSRGSASDIVVVEQPDAYLLHDMAGGAAPVRIDRGALGSDYTLYRAVGPALVMTAPNAAGGRDLHFVDKPDGVLRDRTVKGLPEGATFGGVTVDAPVGTLVVRYTLGTAASTTNHIALVDIATAAVIERRDTGRATPVRSAAASATHLAWTETSSDAGRTLVVAPRGAGDPERTVLGGAGALTVDLLGDWVLYAERRGGQATAPDPLHALTARSLKTGATVRLLDHTYGAQVAADGALFADGGSVEHGEGLYQVSLDADGKPVATMVASTGEPTQVAILKTAVPSVIDLDRGSGVVSLDTTVSRPNVRLEIELTHVASQRRWTATRVDPSGILDRGAATISTSWAGRFNREPYEKGEFTAAYNGAYHWRVTASPLNGIGPATERSGNLTVVRKEAPHDFTDNGSPDLLVVDPAGRLNRYDTSYRPEIATLFWPTVSTVGEGWHSYDRFASPGNLGGAPHADAVTRDRTGILWIHEGTGDRGEVFAPRRKVGSGWQVYNKITGGSDLNGDGKPDLLAADTAGVLWFYAGTGNINAPFAPRKRIGGGWGVYNQLTATGDIAGAAAGDLVARDKDGVLWLYLGKGEGTFAARTRIGGGWSAYSHVVAVGDATRDGRPDLIAYGSGGAYLHRSNGDWRAPFAPRRVTAEPWPSAKVIAAF
ncbi:VCBS repeat-containing protein [Streptomyces sp. NPDC046324]|uniref:VCBS repeat-containing protein n=1 Tax=Streptomyces sp. NPDC046324 TaxID=3154915 RepID=UPI0033CA9A9E